MQFKAYLSEVTFIGLPTWASVTLIVTVVLLCLYIAVILAHRQVIVSSLIKPENRPVIADQIYFLPAASIHITATANVAVSRSVTDNSIISADISELSLDNSIQIQADPKNLLKLDYKGYWFTSDELKLTTDSSGLLSDVAVTAEDRLAGVVSQATDSIKKILTADRMTTIASAGATPVNVTNISFKKLFIVYPDDLLKPELNQPWELIVDGISATSPHPVDASFLLKFKYPQSSVIQTELSDCKKFDGILTRPLTNLHVNVHLNQQGTAGNGRRIFQENAIAHYEFMVPDCRNIVQVPIRRSPFVKKVQTPKFSSGLLTENYINKPAELENLIAIPVSIAKAIIAIPAQLFSFKIAHIQQLNSLNAENQKLEAARQATEKNALEAQKNDLMTAKDLLAAQQNWENTRKDLEALLQQIKVLKDKKP